MSEDLIKRSEVMRILKEDAPFEFSDDEEFVIALVQDIPSADRPQGSGYGDLQTMAGQTIYAQLVDIQRIQIFMYRLIGIIAHTAGQG